MFCRLRQCRQILPKLNLSAILLLFLIKRAALGNLKVNFHCAHWHRFFPLKKGLSKTHQSSLTLKFFLKSPRPSLPLKKAPPLISVFFNSLYDPFGSPCRGQKPQGKRGNRPTRCFFSKTYPSFLTLKEGSTSLSKPLPSQKGKDVPTALSIVFTTPSVPLVGDRNGAQTASLYGWRTIRGLRQQRSCSFLCGDEPALRKSLS